jgi:hypothetical protein
MGGGEEGRRGGRYGSVERIFEKERVWMRIYGMEKEKRGMQLNDTKNGVNRSGLKEFKYDNFIQIPFRASLSPSFA